VRTDARTYPPANDHAAVIAIHADEYAQLSQAYFKLGRYNDAIVAARTGVALDASVLSAWNTLARACIAAGRWEEALNAANNAIRISPEDAVANATLVELYSRR
jgi:tetratricopeptide (TPR) repeat protein